MIVKLTTTNKKHNSTEIPTFTGNGITCILKEGCSIINPVLIFERANVGHTYNYVYIQDFGRYYFVDDIVYQNARILYYCSVDVLASFKTSIGNASAYVLRSAYVNNEYIIDQYYPVTTRLTQYSQDLGQAWKDYNAVGSGAGFWVLGIVNTGGVDYYGFTKTQLDAFMAYLWSEQFVLDILDVLRIDVVLNPQLKAAVDPISYLTCCVWMPFSIFANEEYETAPYFNSTTVTIGGKATSYAAYGITSGLLGTAKMIAKTYTPDLMPHPQSNARGEYLNSPGFTDCRLVIPPFGEYEYNAAEMNQYDQVEVRVTVDCTNGIGKLQVMGKKESATPPLYDVITMLTDVQAQIGVPMPITQIITPGLSVIDMTVKLGGALASAAVGNPVGAVAGTAAAIDTFYNSRVPRATNIGSRGNMAALEGHAYWEYTWRLVADNDPTDHGMPLCAVYQLSTLPGYQMIFNPHISTNGTSEEDDMINGFLSSGYFYE